MRPSFSALMSAAALSALVGIVLPLQTFLGNTSNYDYGVTRLLAELVPAAAILFLVVFALLWLSDRFLRGWLAPVVVSICVLVYLESGPLSFGMPEINGELPTALDKLPRKLWDLAVWVGVVATSVATFRHTRPWLHWAAVAAMLLGLSSLFDVRGDGEDVKRREIDGGGALYLASRIVEAAEYSPNRNVILLVLDSVPATLASDRLSARAEFKSHFPGFIAYRNNIGMHARTRLGVPGMMTGVYYEDGQDVGAYMMSSLGTNSFLQVYRDRGDAVYCMLDFMAHGFVDSKTVQRGRMEEQKGPRVSDGASLVLFRDATEIPNLSLGVISLFRMMPFVGKYGYLMYVMRHQRINADGKGYGREAALYEALAKSGVSSDPRQVMMKFQSHGVHGPMPCKTVVESTDYCIGHLAALMDVLRSRGIYDKSFIVIAADHGSDYVDVPAGEDRKASAMLWVKPDGAAASEKIEESKLATSHSKIAELMCRVASGPIGRSEIDGILHTKDRLYRRYFREDHACRDWIYHEDGRVEHLK